jgi:hypothetical protein
VKFPKFQPQEPNEFKYTIRSKPQKKGLIQKIRDVLNKPITKSVHTHKTDLPYKKSYNGSEDSEDVYDYKEEFQREQEENEEDIDFLEEW